MSFDPSDPMAPPSGNPLEDFRQREAVWFRERNTYSPGTYDPRIHAHDPVVTSNGVPIAPVFRVSQVAPERRWAIREDGEVMDQAEFERAHERYYVGFYGLRNQPTDDPTVRPIPRVERFVAKQIDPTDPRNLIDILVPKPGESKLTQAYDAKADEFVPVIPDDRTAELAARHGIEIAEPEPKPEPEETPVLSSRESECVELRKQGKTHKQIAEALGISSPYVSKLLGNAKKKMEAAS